MNTFAIKVIAIVTMIVDHLGLFLFPEAEWMRLIGRISFPLFAWLIANGANYTHNINRYLLRIFLFALVSQIPFLFANHLIDPGYNNLNIFFTLLFGLITIAVFKKTDNRPLWLVSVILCAGIASFFQADYGALGVLLIVCFSVFFEKKRYMAFAMGVLVIVPYLLMLHFVIAPLHLFTLLALPIIVLYNKKEGPKMQYLFYLFYPLQYVVFYLLLRFFR